MKKNIRYIIATVITIALITLVIATDNYETLHVCSDSIIVLLAINLIVTPTEKKGSE